jgi:hypothetical protein
MATSIVVCFMHFMQITPTVWQRTVFINNVIMTAVHLWIASGLSCSRLPLGVILPGQRHVGDAVRHELSLPDCHIRVCACILQSGHHFCLPGDRHSFNGCNISSSFLACLIVPLCLSFPFSVYLFLYSYVFLSSCLIYLRSFSSYLRIFHSFNIYSIYYMSLCLFSRHVTNNEDNHCRHSWPRLMNWRHAATVTLVEADKSSPHPRNILTSCAVYHAPSTPYCAWFNVVSSFHGSM